MGQTHCLVMRNRPTPAYLFAMLQQEPNKFKLIERKSLQMNPQNIAKKPMRVNKQRWGCNPLSMEWEEADSLKQRNEPKRKRIKPWAMSPNITPKRKGNVMVVKNAGFTSLYRGTPQVSTMSMAEVVYALVTKYVGSLLSSCGSSCPTGNLHSFSISLITQDNRGTSVSLTYIYPLRKVLYTSISFSRAQSSFSFKTYNFQNQCQRKQAETFILLERCQRFSFASFSLKCKRLSAQRKVDCRLFNYLSPSSLVLGNSYIFPQNIYSIFFIFCQKYPSAVQGNATNTIILASSLGSKFQYISLNCVNLTMELPWVILNIDLLILSSSWMPMTPHICFICTPALLPFWYMASWKHISALRMTALLSLQARIFSSRMSARVTISICCFQFSSTARSTSSNRVSPWCASLFSRHMRQNSSQARQGNSVIGSIISLSRIRHSRNRSLDAVSSQRFDCAEKGFENTDAALGTMCTIFDYPTCHAVYPICSLSATHSRAESPT